MATPIPANTATFSLKELAQATGAPFSDGDDRTLRGITTDSRADVAGKLFVALSGDRFDGHAYLDAAIARGAGAVLVERDPGKALSVPVMLVGSTLQALGDISRMHRRRWQGQLVAIAGSAGKTTTRVACQTLLEVARPGMVLGTSGNLNNHIGVPMTLLGLTDAHRYAVVEVGTNAPGEVRYLSELCQPDIAVLTLIGLEHSEGLGDIDAIEREEGDILSALAANGTVVGNADDARVVRQINQRAQNARRVTFGGGNDADYRVNQHLAEDLGRSLIEIQRSALAGGGPLSFESSLVGWPGALAAAAAVAVVESLGVRAEPDLLHAAYAREQLGEAGRLQVVRLDDGIVVLDDSYNANPPSMASSIAVASELARLRHARLLLVLGEMLELGELSEREHRLLGARLGSASQLVAVGGQAQPLFESARAAGVASEYCADAGEAAQCVARLIRTGDVVLVKGSRGVKLEKVVQTLVSRKGYAA